MDLPSWGVRPECGGVDRGRGGYGQSAAQARTGHRQIAGGPSDLTAVAIGSAGLQALEVGEQTFYRWRKGDAAVRRSPRPNGLSSWRGKDARPGRAVADVAVANPASGGSGRGDLVGPTRRRRAVTQAQRELAVLERWVSPGSA